MNSYNGWPASQDRESIEIVPLDLDINGTVYAFPGGCKAGDVHTVFSHFLRRYHMLVEPLGLGGADEWGYAYRKNRNSDNLSCHSSGTAVDVNSAKHPNGSARTLTAKQLATLRDVLAAYEGVIKWGGDFSGTKDEMHFEIHGTEADVARIAEKITPKPKGGDMTAAEHLLLVETRKIAEANGKLLGQILDRLDALEKKEP